MLSDYASRSRSGFLRGQFAQELSVFFGIHSWSRWLYNILKTSLFCFNISLPAWIVDYIKLYYLCVIVVFTYETNACKFSTNFNFCGKEWSFHILDIPLIVIKSEASFKWGFVTKTFLIAKFSVYSLTCLACVVFGFVKKCVLGRGGFENLLVWIYICHDFTPYWAYNTSYLRYALGINHNAWLLDLVLRI